MPRPVRILPLGAGELSAIAIRIQASLCGRASSQTEPDCFAPIASSRDSFADWLRKGGEPRLRTKSEG